MILSKNVPFPGRCLRIRWHILTQPPPTPTPLVEFSWNCAIFLRRTPPVFAWKRSKNLPVPFKRHGIIYPHYPFYFSSFVRDQRTSSLRSPQRTPLFFFFAWNNQRTNACIPPQSKNGILFEVPLKKLEKNRNINLPPTHTFFFLAWERSKNGPRTAPPTPSGILLNWWIDIFSR